MKRNILVIDDNPEDLEFYKELLQGAKQPFHVFLAEDADRALKIFAEQDIHCMFVDYNLPEMNGLKIIEILKERSGSYILPVVILTGEPNQSVQAEAARTGALNYIVKDTTNSSDQLEAIIDKTVEWASVLNAQHRSLSKLRPS